MVVSDLKVTSTAASRSGVYGLVSCFDAENIRICNLEISNSTSTAIYTISSKQLWIEENYVHDQWADGIHISRGSEQVVISNNIIYHNGDDGIGIVSYHGPEVYNQYPRNNQILVSGNVIRRTPARGVMSPQLAPGCVTSERLDPVAATRLPDGTYRFDFGQVVSGVCAIAVSGAAGCRYRITYFEELSLDGQDVNGHQERLGQYVHSGTFQQDTLVAATDAPLAWEPQLVFHGFRYVLVRPSMPEGRVDAIQASFIHTELPRRSSITCGDADFTRLLHCADYSYRGNFIGFPSDCPQREKNAGQAMPAWPAKPGSTATMPSHHTGSSWKPSATPSVPAARCPSSSPLADGATTTASARPGTWRCSNSPTAWHCTAATPPASRISSVQ